MNVSRPTEVPFTSHLSDCRFRGVKAVHLAVRLVRKKWFKCWEALIFAYSLQIRKWHAICQIAKRRIAIANKLDPRASTSIQLEINKVESMNRLPNDFSEQEYSDNGLKGKLLVATPALNGSPFQKTVVLVLQDNESGTFGVVLNRPAKEEMLDAWADLSGHYPDDHCVVHGGPIGGPVFAIHQQASIAEVEMTKGLYVSADSNLLRQVTTECDDPYRIVFGVASWADGQLYQEIERGAWFTLNASPESIFDDAAWMWEKSLRRYGRELTRDVLGVRQIPSDPSLN